MTAFAAYTLEALDQDTACVERIVRMGLWEPEPSNDTHTDLASAELVSTVRELTMAVRDLTRILGERESVETSELLTVAEAAKLLRTTTAAVYARVERGVIPRSAIVRHGRSILLRRTGIA